MAMSPFQTFANREVADLTFCDFTTGKPVLFMDYSNVTSTSLTGETVHATGGMGAPKRVSFGGNREGTLTVETQISCAQLYAMVTGGELTTSAEFLKRYVVTAVAGELTLPVTKGTPVETGLCVYHIDDDCGSALENAILAGKVVTADGIIDDEKYVVYCQIRRDGDVQRLHVTGRVNTRAYTIHGKTYMKDENSNMHDVHMVIYKATPKPEVEFGYTATGDPATMTLTFEMAADKAGNFIDMIYMDDAE